jgi:FtsH-binding integral membrane protein
MKNNIPDLTASPYSSPEETRLAGSAFISRVFAWMFLGLLTTAGVAYYFAATTDIAALFSNIWVLIGTIVLMFGLVIVLSAKVTSMPHSLAVFLFLVFSAVMGFMMSGVVAAYTPGSIAVTFAVTSAMFGTMALLGAVTKMDLTKFGSIMIMALIGLIIGSIINIIWFNETIYWILTGVGIVVFCGLTAYDMQKIKNMAAANSDERLAITGALALYLDFINLFLYLLRIFGNSR